jgi:hypothetical protein
MPLHACVIDIEEDTAYLTNVFFRALQEGFKSMRITFDLSPSNQLSKKYARVRMIYVRIKNVHSIKEGKGRYGGTRRIEYKINYKMPSLFSMQQGRG